MFSPLCGSYKREALAPLLIESQFWVRQEDNIRKYDGTRVMKK